MLTLKVMFQFIRQRDLCTPVELKDAYFHIRIYPAHRKFLRFAYKGKANKFLTVPFELSLALRKFSK